jgi:adenine-specific DNA-methyltransferase
MDALHPFEAQRLLLQSGCDAEKTQAERNRLGQFATPTKLATDVLKYARTLSPADGPVRFLDPALGTGSFYSALLRMFPHERIASAAGVEIDPHYAAPAQELWRDHPLTIMLGDFTEMKPPKEKDGFNLIICNPPYVRHHHIDKEGKLRLQHATAGACGVKIGGLAGLYCYFLGLGHAWLAEDGIAGWLIPSEFMDVNYGVPVKQYLLNKVELLRIHRFDPNDLQFGDALVSSAVVWFRKRKAPSAHTVQFSYGGTLERPTISRNISHAQLQAKSKWTSLAVQGTRPASEGPKLSEFFSIKRGLATGDNSFFILNRSLIVERQLPREFFKPILPGPRYLSSDIIEAEKDGTPKIDRQLFLLDCRLPESEIRAKYPTLWKYLEGGRPSVSDTYLCRHRSPWYSQENRPPPPFLCTYMGRGLEKREKPFRFILNRSKATAANVYLLLYPKPLLSAALEKDEALARRIWEFLDSISSATLLGEGRVYGGGLYKMEPKELANVDAAAIESILCKKIGRAKLNPDLFDGRAA